MRKSEEMIVLIDDERMFKNVPENLVTLRNSEEALEWFNNLSKTDVIEQLWFDHDLGIVDGVKDTTIPVLRWLEEKCFFNDAPKIQKVIVHTSNNVGGKEIVSSMSRYYSTVRVFAGDYLTVD